MINVEGAISLIEQHSDKTFAYGSERRMTEGQMKNMAKDFVREITKADIEWEELSQLRIENTRLKTENEVYRNFLLSSNYKLPKETKKVKEKNV